MKRVMAGASNLSRYADVRTWAEQDRLVIINGNLLMWLLPVDILCAFTEVFNLTYLFLGSYQCAYYQLHGLEFEMHSVTGSPDEGWHLTEYDPATQEAAMKERIRSLIEVYDGPMNGIGNAPTALSRNWFKNCGGALKQQLGKMLYYYQRHVVGAKTSEVMWTCPKNDQLTIGGKRFAKKFVAAGTRATNNYASRGVLAYLLNCYMKPDIQAYFEDFGIQVNPELFAISEVVQWLWRSRIRNGEPIKVFMPSKRMRGLLEWWLSGEMRQNLDSEVEVERYEERRSSAA